MAHMELAVEDRLETFRDLLRQRSGPAVYILDEVGGVVLTAPADPPFPDQARQLVDAMLQDSDNAANDLGRSCQLEAGLSIRVQPVGGRLGRFTVVSVEPFRLRDQTAAGSEQYGLTQRESEVLRGLMSGTGTSDIAAGLGIATSTVAGHIRSIMSKTATNSRAAMLGRIMTHAAER